MSNRSRIPSPCIGVCQLKNQSCTGCGRTPDQIARWSSMSDAERDGLMHTLGRRCSACHRVLPVTGGQAPALCPDCGKH